MSEVAFSKRCTKCDQVKPIEEFSRDSRQKDKRRRDCKACASAHKRAVYATDNKERAKYSERHRKRTYGVTPAYFAELWDAQDGKCAVCDDPLANDRYTHIDHCHKSGAVRGLLCQPCNILLGAAEPKPIRLERAADYLAKHSRHTRVYRSLIELAKVASQEQKRIRSENIPIVGRNNEPNAQAMITTSRCE